MSSPALHCSQADLLSHWMPGSFRVGVIFNPYPVVALPKGPSCSSFPGPDDSFSGHFAPLPASADSSCVVPEPLSFHIDMELNEAEHEQQREAGDTVDSEEEEAAQPYDVSLVMKLEQLRQWQQHMQQQLRAQQLEELLHLQQEQQRLLALMSSPAHNSEHVEELSGAEWEETTLHSSTACNFHNMEGEEEPQSQRSPQYQSQEPSMRFSSKYQEEEQLLTQSCSSRTSADRPIRPGIGAQKTFEDMLEEQLRHEEKRLNSVHPQQSDSGGHTCQARPKKAFLRKGEGLLRFTGHTADVHKNQRTTQTEAIICSNSERVSVHTGQSSCIPKPLVQRKTAMVSQECCPTTSLRQDTKAARLKGLQSQLRLCQPPPQPVQRLLEGPASTAPAEPAPCRSRASEASPLAKGAHHRDGAPPTGQGLTQGQGWGQEQEWGQKQAQAGARSSQEQSFQERLLRWEGARQEESMELGEFELLEQAAEELSFSSNSSFVLKVLQLDQQKQLPVKGLHRRLSSTPVKAPSHPSHPVSLHGPTEGGPRQDARLGLCEASWDSWERQDDPGEQLPSGPSVYAFPCQSNPPYDKHTYQDQDHSLYSNEQDEGEGEDCTVTENLLEQRPSEERPSEERPSEERPSEERPSEERPSEERPSEERGQEEPEEQMSRVLFDDHDTWSQLSQDHSFSTDGPGELASPPECAVEQKAQPSRLMSRLLPALKTHSHNAPVSAPPTATEPRSTPPTTHPQQTQSLLLRERLAELEVEIQRFKKENASLAKLRKDNLRVQEELRRERGDFEQTVAQERSCFEEYKREEMRKLQRERRLLENHISIARTVPNKNERKEIQALKQQLSSVQEELRRKECRWANTHSRLRHQLEALGKDNSALREEVKTLEKLRIMAWKKTVDCDKPSAAKGVKFATPLDSSRTSQKSPPAPDTRGTRRASAPGGTVGTKEIKSSLRRPSLTVTAVKETELGDQNQSSLSPKKADGCSPGETQSEPRPAQDCDRSVQGPQEEVPGPDGKVEQVLSSGARLIVFPNGTKKEVSSDGQTVKVTFFNRDTKELTADQRVIYYYAEAKTTHITYPDGMEVLHFPNNQTEKHFPDGRKEITFPDQTVKNLYPNGQEESVLTDGTVIQVHPDGTKEIHFNTGQREVHTAEYKRREYPDGTVKTVYSDGRQETLYPTGRLRVKDKEGNVILDTP
ncbi:centromere protein J [Periophthalmus magnuspinnatus]|uniref:centromere protein J n=1 Tax=Periophthalmus magnuspinnatus TaxID=409849 RepID=UPI0024373454|nr:centromere protein J [Periophthalmus magnuspinnatus]